MDLNSTEKLPHLKTINNTLQNRLPLGHGGQLSPGQGSWWIVHRLSFERYSYFRGISSWLSKVMQAIYKWKWFHVNVLTESNFMGQLQMSSGSHREETVALWYGKQWWGWVDGCYTNNYNYKNKLCDDCCIKCRLVFFPQLAGLVISVDEFYYK